MNLQVLVKELGRVLIVGEDAADLGGSDHDIFRTRFCVEFANGCSIEQIEFFVRLADEMPIAEPLQLAPDRAADQASMARHMDS